MRAHICPRCGLILNRDENAALNRLARGLALARERGRWSPETGGAVGHTGTERLGTAGLLQMGERPSVAPLAEPGISGIHAEECH
jgi:hypothetical protein